MVKEKITFNDLSTSLKVLVIGGWFVVGLFAFYFLVAVIAGMMGVPLE